MLQNHRLNPTLKALNIPYIIYKLNEEKTYRVMMTIIALNDSHKD